MAGVLSPENDAELVSDLIRRGFSSDADTRDKAWSDLVGMSQHHNFLLVLLLLVEKPQEEGEEIRFPAASIFRKNIKSRWEADNSRHTQITNSEKRKIQTLIVKALLDTSLSFETRSILNECIIFISTLEPIRYFGNTKPHTDSGNIVTSFMERILELVGAHNPILDDNYQMVNVLLRHLNCLLKIFLSPEPTEHLQEDLKFCRDEDVLSTSLKVFSQTLRFMEHHGISESYLECVMLICYLFKCLHGKFSMESLQGDWNPGGFVGSVCHFFIDSWSQTPRATVAAGIFLAKLIEFNRVVLDNDLLRLISKDIVLPCLMLDQHDEIMFRDKPDEYMSRDMEWFSFWVYFDFRCIDGKFNFDFATRRVIAMKLLAAMYVNYLERESKTIESYCLDLINENSCESWRSIDCALFLGMSSHIVTGRGSISSDLVHSFIVKKLPDLVNLDDFPILESSLLKYWSSRKEKLKILPLVITPLRSKSTVVVSYASRCIWSCLRAIKYEDFQESAAYLLASLLRAVIVQPEVHQYTKDCMVVYFAKVGGRVWDFDIDFVSEFFRNKFYHIIVDWCQWHITQSLDCSRHCKCFYLLKGHKYLFESMIHMWKITSDDKIALRNQFLDGLILYIRLIIMHQVREIFPYTIQVVALIMKSQSLSLLSYLNPDFVVGKAIENIPENLVSLILFVRAALQISGNPGILAYTSCHAIRLVKDRLSRHAGFYLVNTFIECSSQESLIAAGDCIWMVMLLHVRSQIDRLKFMVSCSFFIIKFGAKSFLHSWGENQHFFKDFLDGSWVLNLESVTTISSLELTLVLLASIELLCVLPLRFPFYWNPKSWATLLNAILTVIFPPEDVDEDDIDCNSFVDDFLLATPEQQRQSLRESVFEEESRVGCPKTLDFEESMGYINSKFLLSHVLKSDNSLVAGYDGLKDLGRHLALQLGELFTHIHWSNLPSINKYVHPDNLDSLLDLLKKHNVNFF